MGVSVLQVNANIDGASGTWTDYAGKEMYSTMHSIGHSKVLHVLTSHTRSSKLLV